MIEGRLKRWYDDQRLNEAIGDRYVPLRFVVGSRGVGKTQWMIHDIVKRWYEGNKQTFWVRNKQKTIEDATFGPNFLNDAYKLGWISEDEAEHWKSTKFGVFYDDVQVVHFRSINTAFDTQGNAFPDVDRLFIDEFTIRKGSTPITNVAEKLGSLWGTLRDKPDFQIYMMSNFTAISNPYWAYLRIYPFQNDGVTLHKIKGYIDGVYHEQDNAVAIEVIKTGTYNSSMYDLNNPAGLAIALLQGGSNLDSAQGDANYSLLISNANVGKMKRLPWHLVINHHDIRFYSTLGLIYVKSYDTYTETGNSSVAYCVDPRDISDGVMRMTETSVRVMIQEPLEQGAMRFCDPNALYDIMYILYNI